MNTEKSRPPRQPHAAAPSPPTANRSPDDSPEHLAAHAADGAPSPGETGHLRREADHRKDSQTAVPGSGEEDRDSSAAEDNQPSTQDSSLRLPKIIRFETLARCGDEVWIENNGQIYRLRRTRQGKLILTK